MLSNVQIKSQLQIANCCGAKKVNTYIDGLKNGKYCPELLTEANILFGLIDSIRCYTVFDETTEVNSSVNIVVPFLMDIMETSEYAFSIGKCVLASGTYTFEEENPITTEVFVNSILDALGIEYSINYDTLTYTLTLPCFYTTIPVSQFGFYISSPEVLEPMVGDITSGVCSYPYEDCITYEQVLNILAAIKRICNGSCADYVTIQSN